VNTTIDLKNELWSRPEEKVRYLRRAARRSSGNLKLWYRYLNKVINLDCPLTDIDRQQLFYFSQAADLTAGQRAVLRLALNSETAVHQKVVNYNQPIPKYHWKERLQNGSI